jgi:hypothetical protein
MTEGREDFETVRSGLERLRAYAPGPELSNPNVWTATKAKDALDRIEARLQAVTAERDTWKRRYEALREER